MSGHTPAPWRAQGIWVFDDNDDPIIAKVAYRRSGIPAAKANARLIAAAPEMLKALRVLISAIDHIRGDLGTQYPALSEAYVLGRDAIAKAEGR